MIAIKSYTDLSQSKKLAEFLPLETADMCFVGGMDNAIMTPYLESKRSLLANFCKADFMSPCWSLASLLNILPEVQNGKPVISLYDNYITYPHVSDLYIRADILVDACYEMIIKLHRLNLL